MSMMVAVKVRGLRVIGYFLMKRAIDLDRVDGCWRR